MLQRIRDNSQGWIAKTIIGLIVLLMALTGVEAIFNSSGSRGEVAQVNGEAITQTDLGRAVTMQRDQLLQQLGAGFDPAQLDEALLRDAALRNLIDRTLLLQAARDAGFAFSQAALDQVILKTAEFQVDGQFNAQRFDQVIQRLGYSRADFRRLLEQEMLIGQLQAGIAGTAFSSDAQVKAFIGLDQQTRDFRQVVMAANPAAATVSDEEVAQYYEANEQRFRTPEQVVVDYVELKKERFFDQVEISESALEELYQKQVADLAEQRRAAHILVEVNDQRDDAQAKAAAEALRARIEAGEDFAAVAREASDDAGSAPEGGDLGFAGPGVYDPAFEQALYALQKEQVSEPVRSEFGWHLIKLLDTQAPEVPALEALRPELERQLREAGVEQRFVEASRQLEASAYEASDLSQPASELGLDVQTTPAFGREGGQGVAANRQFVQTAFSDGVLVDGMNSSLLELDPETVVVLRVKQHLKPETQPLEQVREGIVQRLQAEKAAEQAKAEGEALVARLKAGEDVGTLDWKTFEAAGRAAEGVDPAVLQAVFRMPHPVEGKSTHGGVALGNGDYVVLQLDGVAQPESLDDPQLLPEYRRFLASRSGQLQFNAYLDHLRATADIERK